MARAVEILGDRWTLLIVRDLICGSRNFNQLERGLPGISRAILSERLKRLVGVGIIERQSTESQKVDYILTQAGWDLYPIVESLTRWGAKWAFGEPQPDELNPVLLMWWMRDRVYRDRLPHQRVVVEFDFLETRPHHYWLVLQPEDVSVCVKHPGYDIDILVTTRMSVFYKVWLGQMPFDAAIRDAEIRVDAIPGLIRDFPQWFALSPAVEILALSPA